MKSDRTSAMLLMVAAMVGILIANSPFASGLQTFKSFELNFGILQIDVEHITSEFLLAVFFLVAGLELKYELRLGALSTTRAALVPIVSAVAGVIVPAIIYLTLNPSSPASAGWPIPTATDIAFALGMLAILGRGLPSAARVFLLALAIFDDLIAIMIIAFGFTNDLKPIWLGFAIAIAVIVRVAFPKAQKRFIPVLLATSFLAAWLMVHESGVHATIAGVLIGIAVPARKSHTISKVIQPFSNLIILPLFAFVAVSITLPKEFSTDSSVFLGVALALPLGKILGIALVGYMMNRLAPEGSRLKLTALDFAAVAALAGIGFTVSLLLARLSFAQYPLLAAEAVFGVLIGSFASVLLAMVLIRFRSGFGRARKMTER